MSCTRRRWRCVCWQCVGLPRRPTHCRRRVRQEAQQRGRTVSQKKRELCDFRSGKAVLGLWCRCALLSATLNSLAGNLPPELLEGLVREGLWLVEQALAYA